MAKGNKHLKVLKSERAKVKLKSSKKKHLPKGTNITDTSFKVKQIVIRSQLKQHSNAELLSKRKLNIKELLNRLQHYNTTVRNDAITDLRELITTFPTEIVQPNLFQLIKGISHLVVDSERQIRRDSFRLIALTLSQSSADQMSPFFDILSSYFRCAMTHINTSIQEDSLLFLDVLLMYVPSLVARNSAEILDDFFNLISKLRSDSKPGRTLTLNLGSKLTAVKWRVKVLCRLHQLLEAVVQQKEASSGRKISTKTIFIKYDPLVHANVPLYRTEFLNPFVLNSTGSNIQGVNEAENYIVKYVDMLVPMLYETWLEVGPTAQKEDINIDVNLTEEATSILNCILKILQLFYTFIQIYTKETGDLEMSKQFISKYSKDFSSYIVSHFPYTKLTSRKRKINETDKLQTRQNLESLCIVENLMICHVFCLFNNTKLINTKNQNGKENAGKLLKYVQNLFSKWTPNSDEENTQTIRILQILLLEVSRTWANFSSEFFEVLDKTIGLYKNKRVPETVRTNLFNILCEIVHDSELSKVVQFQSWLTSLPELLCGMEISDKIINTISLLARQKNEPFLHAFESKLVQILANLERVKITETNDELNSKCTILSLVYFVPTVNIMALVTQFLVGSNDPLLKKYLRDILTLKFQMNNNCEELQQLTNII